MLRDCSHHQQPAEDAHERPEHDEYIANLGLGALPVAHEMGQRLWPAMPLRMRDEAVDVAVDIDLPGMDCAEEAGHGHEMYKMFFEGPRA